VAPALRGRLAAAAAHPVLVGDPDEPGPALVRRTRRLTLAAIALANAVGASVVIAFSLFGLPRPPLDDPSQVFRLNLVLAVGYTLVALAVGMRWGTRRLEHGPAGMRGWLEADRAPTAAERAQALRAPVRVMTVEAVLWGVAVLGFTLLNLVFDPLLALGVACTVALGGVTTSAAAYLLCELSLRPVVVRALSHVGPRTQATRVATRWLLAWALGTAVPVVGLALVAVVALTSVDISEGTLAVTVLALCAISLVFGATVSALAAYATIHPITAIRQGLDRVRTGDLDAAVRVWDTTEVGLLQDGFNEMVRGLRERERLRDVFGRQVGEDVARRALESDLALGGEVREVAVLFVDLVGSTQMAVELPPQAVVERLNRFFAVVVECVETAGGWINKFEGDAALAIFGAPVGVPDAPTAALQAARALARRLPEEVPEVAAAVGVAFGPAVAGNVGAERRFEYTVIGDPVNEAARLTEIAKVHDPRVLASGDALDAAAAEEAAHWHVGDEVTLRGRATPTRLACLTRDGDRGR
jgi:adenylate cyclase